MSFYGNMAAVAKRLLTKYGQSVTFSAVSSTLNPVTGAVTSTTSTFAGYGAAFDYDRNEIDGTVVQAGDIRLILEATATAPAIGNTCSIDSKAYRVMGVSPSSPGGAVTHYNVQLRK